MGSGCNGDTGLRPGFALNLVCLGFWLRKELVNGSDQARQAIRDHHQKSRRKEAK